MEGTYGYIPLPNKEFLPSLTAAYEYLGPSARFIDVGCGVGTKVIRASRLGWDAYGIEINPRFVRLAQRFGAAAIEADARTWNGYADFDCVFMFHLLTDVDQERELEYKVMEAMKPGALLILYGIINPRIDEGWEEIGFHVWRKPWHTH